MSWHKVVIGMNKFFLFSVIFLTGCTSFSTTVTNTIDRFGMTPSYAKNLPNERQKKLEVPSLTVSDDIPEGAFVQNDDKGVVIFKTVVNNRCFDKYMDVYYPNGKLRTRTPLVNCKAEGLSTGYTESGLLRTEIFYKGGVANGEVKIYDATGKLAGSKIYRDGYPE